MDFYMERLDIADERFDGKLLNVSVLNLSEFIADTPQFPEDGIGLAPKSFADMIAGLA